jgi:hypothetical protein
MHGMVVATPGYHQRTTGSIQTAPAAPASACSRRRSHRFSPSFFLRLPDRLGRKARLRRRRKQPPAHIERERDSPCNVNNFLERHRRQTFCKVSGDGGRHTLQPVEHAGRRWRSLSRGRSSKRDVHGLEVQSRSCPVSLLYT